MDNRRRHGWPLWSAFVLIAVPFLYVLSFGPACWITSRCSKHSTWILTAYPQMVSTMKDGHPSIAYPIGKYASLCVAPGTSWRVDDEGRVKALVRD